MTTTPSASIKVGIVGATGYTGVELLRLMAQHPHAEVKAVTSRQESGRCVSDMFPSLRGHLKIAFTSPDDARLDECDVVFFATPHGVAMNEARQLLDKGVKVIDLAADFRLQNLDAFKHWYKQDHACPDVLHEAVYGLVELNREQIRHARVVGNPGCYPVTVITGLLPLLEKNLIDTQHIIADCKSGVSGAGRNATQSLLFAEVSDSFKAYGVSGHRHHPEITEKLTAIAGADIGLTFVPHLVPMVRGMFSTIYARIRPEAMDQDFQAVFEERYKDEPFIDVLPAGSLPETRFVRGSNYVRLAVQRPGNGDQLIILVTQDNLVKGAAGQAVQNMNLMFGLDETAGLTQLALIP